MNKKEIKNKLKKNTDNIILISMIGLSCFLVGIMVGGIAAIIIKSDKINELESKNGFYKNKIKTNDKYYQDEKKKLNKKIKENEEHVCNIDSTTEKKLNIDIEHKRTFFNIYKISKKEIKDLNFKKITNFFENNVNKRIEKPFLFSEEQTTLFKKIKEILFKTSEGGRIGNEIKEIHDLFKDYISKFNETDVINVVSYVKTMSNFNKALKNTKDIKQKKIIKNHKKNFKSLYENNYLMLSKELTEKDKEELNVQNIVNTTIIKHYKWVSENWLNN